MLTAFLLLTLADAPRENAPRPNVLVILADDMGYSDVGCYGGEIDTPHIDALADEGLRFTRLHNAGRCCPTRASLLTGLHPHQAGIGHMTEPPERPLGIEGPYQGHLNDRCTTLAEVLRSAGYATSMAGKWHLGMHRPSDWPTERGFERFTGCLAGGLNYFRPGGNRRVQTGVAGGPLETVDTPEGWYATDAFADAAIESIRAAAGEGKPFFHYLAFNAPHWPVSAPPADFKKYRGRYTGGWEPVMNARFERQKAMGLFGDGVERAPTVGPDWASLPAKTRDDLDARMAVYAGCVHAMDRAIGRVTGVLDELGVAENTLVLFLSDNGACQEGGDFGSGTEKTILDPPLETTKGPRVGLYWANAQNTPYRLYKHFVHEGGANTPAVVRWPAGIPADRRGSLVRTPAYLPDVMATCLELSGAAYPEGLPPHAGRSLAGVLTGEAESAHDEPLFFEHEGNAAVIDGRWKLVREYQKPWELYDLEADPTELTDLAADDASRRDAMAAAWRSWADSAGVAYPERFNMYEFLRKGSKKSKK